MKEGETMKISCCFLHMINHFGYPPKLKGFFKYLQTEKELGLKVINFSPILPEVQND